MKNGRDDEIDVAQINRNREVCLNSTQDTPWNESIMSGDADYGEVLYSTFPEDRIGLMTNGRKRS
jgi:hypothetical protein